MSIYDRRKEWEDLQHLGFGLNNSLQSSLDMFSSMTKNIHDFGIHSNYRNMLGEKESFALQTARETMNNIGVTRLKEYEELMKSDYVQAMEKRANEFSIQYNEMRGYKKELLDTATGHINSFISPSYEKLLEAEKFAQSGSIEDYTKITDRFESGFVKQIQDSIVDPAMGYVEQMQTMLNEPMLKMQEYATMGLSRVEELQQLHFGIATTNKIDLDKLIGDISIENSISNILKGSSIEDISHLATATYGSYKHIQNILDHELIAGVVPKDIDKLVRSFIDTEMSTQQYLRTHDISLSVEIEKSSIELKLDEVIESNAKIYALLLTQKDPIIKLFFIIFLLPYFINILTNISYDYQVKPKIESLKNDKKVSSSNQKKFRKVTADRLNVRDGKSKKSIIIGHLQFSNIVEIVKKEKNWTLVKRYNTDNETLIQGWVFTRYLAQIN